MHWAALSCLTLAGLLACAAPCREAESLRSRRDFELAHERCEARARKVLGNIDVGDYRACMRVRGWCSAPDDAFASPAWADASGSPREARNSGSKSLLQVAGAVVGEDVTMVWPGPSSRARRIASVSWR